MTDVDETFTRRRHRKTPILGKKKQKKKKTVSFSFNFISFVVSILFSALGGIMNLTVKNVRQRRFFLSFLLTCLSVQFVMALLMWTGRGPCHSRTLLLLLWLRHPFLSFSLFLFTSPLADRNMSSPTDLQSESLSLSLSSVLLTHLRNSLPTCD